MVRGSISRCTAKTAETSADAAMTRTIAMPARSSARPKPYVYARVAARRPSQKAIPSGTAVSASATLCRVSPSSATEPEKATIAAWARAVTVSAIREIHRARMPARDDSSASSTLPAVSCECGRKRWSQLWA